MNLSSSSRTGAPLTGLSPRAVGRTIGAVCVIGGGLVAAATGPLELEKGSWLAAYLVLIAGVAQIVLADQQHLLAPNQDARRSEWVTMVLWVTGNAAVIVGSLLSAPFLVDAGGIALVIALILAWIRTRGASNRALGWTFRVVFGILIVSVPIGLVLAHVRA